MKSASNITIVEVPMHKIVAPKDELRKQASEEGLVELWRSVKRVGLLAPIIVRKMRGDKLELVLGSRRLQSHRRFSKKETIPAVVTTGIPDAEALVMALSENMHREDLTPFEEAWGIFKLVNDYKLGIEETAKKIGRAASFVRRRLQLLSLPQEVQQQVARRRISMAQINTLAKLPPDQQIAYARKVTRAKLSNNELATLVRKERKPGKPVQRRNAPAGAYNGQRVSLRIDGFTEWLKSVESHVPNMSGAGLHNVQLSLRELLGTVNQFLGSVDKAL